MKLGLYFSYATRSLIRGGQRTALAIFCVAVGVMAIVGLQLVGQMVNEGLTTNVQQANGGDVSVRSDLAPLRASQLSSFDKLKSQGTITGYTAISQHTGSANDKHDSGSTSFSLLAVNPSTFPLNGAPFFRNPGGGTLSSIVTGQTVIITTDLQSSLGVNVGDSIQVTSDDGRVFTAKIGGIIASSGFYRGQQMYMALDAYSAVPSTSGLPATFATVYVNVPGHTDANGATAKSAIGKIFPLATVTTTKDALAQNQSQVQNIRYFLEVVGLLALLIGGIGIINTMQVLLRRRQTEIAMLKTAGYRRGDLYALFGLEAALLGLVGGVIGSAVGVGVSLGVRALVQNLLATSLPLVIDWQYIVGGVVIGLATALIFGLMPIVQAAQIRPLAVLRESSEGLQGTGLALSLLLSVILAALFFLLAYVILQNLAVAVGSVAGAGIFLVILAAVFLLIVLLIGSFPVPERLTWWYAAAVIVVAAVGILIALNKASSAFGSLILAVVVLAAIAVFLPRTPKSNVRMAIRNVGRQRGRTVTTLTALFIGVFAIGLILTLGQNIRDEINNVLSAQTAYNSFVVAGTTDKSKVDDQLAHNPKVRSQVSGEYVSPVANTLPTAVRGVPIGQFLGGVSNAGGRANTGRQGAEFFLSGVQGYNLASGQAAPGVKLMTGYQATNPGRLLNAADAGTNNVLAPYPASLAPLSLKVGDTVTIENAALAAGGGQSGASGPPAGVTVTVVGFYSGDITASIIPLKGDASLAQKIAGNNLTYVYYLRITPTQSDTVLHLIHNAAPATTTFSLADLSVAINSLLTNLITLITAVASLAMIAGLIIIANAVGLAMLERRRELGILKSVGYTSSNILSQVLVENGLIGFTGALAAMLLVTLAIFLLANVLFKTNLTVSAPLTLAIVGATALLCMIIAAAVAWGATRVRPLEVLRYE